MARAAEPASRPAREPPKKTTMTMVVASRHHPRVPMPTVTTWVKDPTEILFIDQQAPDYQLLASGVKPGIEVVVSIPTATAIQQIANFLQRHPDPNLTTIDIVAHGQDGMLFSAMPCSTMTRSVNTRPSSRPSAHRCSRAAI